MSERKSTASKEGYKLLGDQDLLNGVEARARQLEAERANHLLNRAEAEAVGEEQAVEAIDEAIASVEKRLEIVHARRDVLKSGMPKAGDTKPPAAQ